MDVIKGILYVMLVACFCGLGVCVYVLYRNEHVCKFHQWFIRECYKYNTGKIKDGHRIGSLDALGSADHIMGSYDHMLYHWKSFEDLILDRDMFDEILCYNETNAKKVK